MTVTIKGACITAAGTICAGLLAGLISLCTHNTNTPPPRTAVTASRAEREPHHANAEPQTERKPDPANAELVALLKSRAADVVWQLDQERGEIFALQSKVRGKKGHEDEQDPSPFFVTKPRRSRLKKGPLGNSESNADVAAALAEIFDGLEQLKAEFRKLHHAHIEALSNDHTTLAHDIHAKIQRLLLVNHQAIYEDAGGEMPSPLLMYYSPPPIRIGSWEVEVDLYLHDKYPIESPAN